MKILSEANQTVLKILKRVRKKGSCTRMLQYCVETPVEEGVLLFNLLTRELILLTEEEYRDRLADAYLQAHWFVVPEDAQDKEYAELVKWVISSQKPTSDAITGYTIFTTTDCNARCFYCFERGRSRVPMSEETARKTVRYIKDHCRGEAVKLAWFGGEPLVNHKVIGIICEGLRREGVEFTSTMTSNGILFDEALVQTAAAEWNLKQVQITLDGTEDIYNRVKAYVGQEGSAYRKVLENMKLLLDASVKISVRLNMELYNAEDLLMLVDELAREFAGRKGLSVYAHHIYQDEKAMADIHSEEGWALRHEAMCRLQERIEAHGLGVKTTIRKKVKRNRCMADSGSAVTILPGGEIGLCEGYSESEWIGHLDRAEVDAAVVAAWKESVPEETACRTCFYYPDCFRLKKCNRDSVCFPQQRQEYLLETRQRMRNTYQRRKDAE